MTKKIVVGRLGRTHGVKGWLKVISFTEPKENILSFSPWFITTNGKWQELLVATHRIIADGLLVKLKGVDDCDCAQSYVNLNINIEREQLPLLSGKQYYWTDLEGLKAIDINGQELGIIDHIFATGANDVLVIKRGNKELLVPYLKDVIIKVDLDHRTIKIDYEI